MGINNITMLPFLGEEELEELTKKVLETEERNYKGVSLKTLLPFLDEDFINDYVFKHEIESNRDVTFIFPFLEGDNVDEFFIHKATLGEYDDLFYKMLPFVSDDGLNILINKYINNEIKDGLDLNAILPFLDDESIRKLFKNVINDQL